ncbi:uncharacterized protein LOC126981732 isoform X2 [Eriocheir sinensis]|nr:uncharacterized protein LOC126981732 isoform X2 [Eriocheir sinensis]
MFTPGEEHRPRSLPCGHTFCTSCVAHLLKKGAGCLACPECRLQHPAPRATHFPVNYGMEALIDQLKCLVMPPGVVAAAGPEGAGCCEEGAMKQPDTEAMKEKVIELLVACGATQTQLEQHQEKLKEPRARHTTLLNRLGNLVGDNRAALVRLNGSLGKVRDLAEEGKGYVLQLQVALSRLESVSTAQEADIVVERVAGRVEQVEEWRERSGRLCYDEGDGALTTSCQVLGATQAAFSTLAAQGIGAEGGADFIGGADLSGDDIGSEAGVDIGAEDNADVLVRAQNTLTPLPSHTHTLTPHDIRTMTPQVKRMLENGQVWGVHREGSSNPRSSMFTLEGDRLHLYHLCNHPPPAHAQTLQVSNYLPGNFHFCTLAFLDLAWGLEVRGRVYIRLDMFTPLARQFMMLCTAEHRHTYANTAMLKVCGRGNQGEFVMGGDYECDDGSGGAPILSELQGGHRKTGAAGSVWGRWEVEGPRSAQFAITTRECQGTIPRVFGTVEEGMSVLKQAVNVIGKKRVTIDECGVVVAP